MIKFTIPIAPVTKKNHSQIIFRGRRPKLIPSEQYLQYEKDAAWFMPKLEEPIESKINIKAIYYMNTNRIVDLVGLHQALCDVLVKYGVIKDDNSRIVATMDGSEVRLDRKNPRTEIEIERVE